MMSPTDCVDVHTHKTGSGGVQGEGQSCGQATGRAELPEREIGRGQQDIGQA